VTKPDAGDPGSVLDAFPFDKPDQNCDHGHYQENMYKTAGNVVNQEAYYPGNNKNNRNCNQKSTHGK
jgi:hypothetical protein